MGTVIMWNIRDEEIEKRVFFQDEELLKELKGSSFLISGATGLLGQTIIKMLVRAEQYFHLGLHIYGLIRSEDKVKKVFAELMECPFITWIKTDILDPGIRYDKQIPEALDYVIHTASITDSKMFITNPVETIRNGVLGTDNIFQLAVQKQAKSIVYLSSMEAYGTIDNKKNIREEDIGRIELSEVRNSYPATKRICERLCLGYDEEYGMNVKIVRLVQTFGPGVMYQDNRVFMEFARCALEGKNIVLHTTGKSERMYVYSYDAAEAILFVLLKGKQGGIYNVANPETYCSILQMADLVKDKIAQDKIEVLIKIDKVEAQKYTKEHHLFLDTSRIEDLGWKPGVGLEEMFRRMISALD